MNRRIILLIAISALFTVPVRATIPLVLEQTLQLPPCTSWDVQHWMDSTSFGYAYLQGSTVYWAAHVGDAEQALPLPPDSSYCWAFWTGCVSGLYYEITPFAVKLLRHPTAPQDLHALVQVNAHLQEDDYSWMYHYLLLYDLSIRSLVDSFAFDGGARIDGRWTRSSTLNDFTFLPRPPFVSTRLVVAQYYSWSYDWHAGGASRHEYGRILESDLTRDGIALNACCSGTQIRVFNSPPVERYAIMNYNYYWDNYDNIDHYRWSRTVRTLYPPADTLDISSDSNYVALCAQTDGSGTQRIIVDYNWRPGGTIALNPDNGDTLWHVPVSVGGEVARLAESADERILHSTSWHLNTFDVYNAADGSFIDHLAPFADSLRYIIRRPNHNSEFVTFDDFTRIVQVYASLPPVPNGLTCSFISGTGVLRLRWQAVPGAVRYWIYASSTAHGQYWPLDHVNAGTTSYDISPASSQRFFQVTAEY